MNFAFAFEPKEGDIMKRKPSEIAPQKVLTNEMITIIFGIGFITSIILLLLYIYLKSINYPADDMRTIIFAGLSLDAMFFAFPLKSLRKPLWRIDFMSNKYLLAAFATSLTFLIGAMTIPFMQKLLGTVTPSLVDALIMVGIGITNLILIEAAKYYFIVKKSA